MQKKRRYEVQVIARDHLSNVEIEAYGFTINNNGDLTLWEPTFQQGDQILAWFQQACWVYVRELTEEKPVAHTKGDEA